MNEDKAYIIGIAGGSGSGKTYLARALHKILSDENCALIYQDNYYIDQSKNFDHDGGKVNFDHPDALDFDLLSEHLRKLKNGISVNIPIYDFKTHSRLEETIYQKPKKVIIVDGILILSNPKVRTLFDDSIFVDTDENLRFERRLRRDVEERGRTPEGVKAQFIKQVKPMHDLFVEPSKMNATYVSNDLNKVGELLSTISEKIFTEYLH